MVANNKTAGKRRDKSAHLSLPVAPPAAVIVRFVITFYDGAGGIYFHGENIPDNKYIDSATTVKEFSVSQSPGHQIVTVAGSAPSEGKITVRVNRNTTVLSPASENIFDKMTFSG